MALNHDDRDGSEAAFREGLERGQFTFIVAGEKLRGEFALIRFRNGGEKAWLLVKKRDEFASSEDITATQERSVRSGRTLEEIRESAEAGAAT